jgi:hypothetical protein
MPGGDILGGESGGEREEWGTFPGGELDAPRPRAVCADCRDRTDARERRPLCFACYRAHLTRERAIQQVLARTFEPFPADTPGADSVSEPVQPTLPALVSAVVPGNVRRFAAVPRTADDPRYTLFTHRRRQAQIAARRALSKPVLSLEEFPVSWRPFIRVAMQA